MFPVIAGFQRHFLPWHAPWLPQVAAWLARGWSGMGPLDLSRVLAVVPTRQAGRRLREALAEQAAARGSAAFPPRTCTPDTLLQEGAAAPGVATRLEALLAWVEVLRAAEPADYPDVFPAAPPPRDFSRAWRLAETFYALQTQLTEGGLGMEDVAARAGDGWPEIARWRQLGALERRQAESLAALGKTEPHAARRRWAHEAPPPEGIERLVVLGVADPLPLAQEVLARWSAELPIAVVIFAPESEAAAFDEAGRPRPEVWCDRPLEWPDFERRVHLVADPPAAAQLVTTLVRHQAEPDGLVAVGSADLEVLPPLEIELTRAGIAHYNPEGSTRQRQRLHPLLAALAALGRAPTADAVAALARCPDFLAALCARHGGKAAGAQFLAELDAARARHFPADLAALCRIAGRADSPLARGLALVSELRTALENSGFPAGAGAALAELFRARRFARSQPEEEQTIEGLAAWRETMRLCAAAARLFPRLSADEWWEVALRLWGEGRQAGEKPAGAIELSGWLELPWEDAPHLIIAGLNEGLVPEAIVGDAFLPEMLRERLGLKTNPARLARDAYWLQAMARSRQTAGRLDLILARTSAAGDPLRPSRLLLRCAEADLPARIDFLFRAATVARALPVWTRAWRLTPRRVASPGRVAVTGLRAWLACPFRFYLQHVLKMEAVDPTKRELDARDFGTLCHTALEAMAREPGLQGCTDEEVLRDFLLAELERAARLRFGQHPSVPLVVQLESARQRLARAAAVQAREHAVGWRLERVEWPFVLALGGLEVRGRIDRIDRHEESGSWRVLDYKTSDTGLPPPKTHLRPRRAGDENLPSWRCVALEGREYVWTDLQLPLYLRALGAEAGAPASLIAGYFNLPKAAGETRVAAWPELAGQLRAAADACAEGVAAAIGAGEFWPPAEISADQDAFAALLPHGAAESVQWEPPP